MAENMHEDAQELDNGTTMLLRLDQLPFSSWHVIMTLALGLVWIFDGYEVSLISLFRMQIARQSSDSMFKSLITAYQIGCIIGSLLFGLVAFALGRRKVFLTTLIIYFFGVLLSGIPSENFLFLFGRFLTGLSVGGEYTAIFSAVDEFLPPTYRGRVNIGIDGTWHLGGSAAAVLTLIIGETPYWRELFLVGLIGIVSLFLLRRNVPESPRWLISKQRHREAHKIIDDICETVLAHKMLLQQTSQPLQDDAVWSPTQSHSVCTYFTQIISLLKEALYKHTRRCLVSFTLIFSQAFFFNLVYYHYPQTLGSKYSLNQTQISLYMLPLSVSCFVSTLLIGPLFDKVGRKWMLLTTYCASGILLIFSQLITTLNVLEIFICFMFFFSSPASSAANLIASEVFPTSSRTIMLFFMFIASILGGICGVWIDYESVSAVLMIIAGLLAFWLCPSAENKSLEEVENL